MSKLLFNEPPLCVSPSLATVVGLNEALLLQQIHYWLDPRINKNCINGMHWVYNSYKDWQRQFPFFTEITIRRTIKKLEEMKLLIADNFNTKRSDNTKWYTINYEALQSLEIRSEVNLSRPDQNDQAITSKQSRGLIKMSRRPDQSDQVLYSDTKNNTKTSTNTLPKTKGGEGIRMLSKESMEREMLLIWNEVADNAISRDTSPKRAKELQRVLTEYFNNNIDEWKLFCKTIASNDFLMGRTTKSTWKASLSWAIKPDSIEKIREGSYEKGKGAQPQAITESLDADSSNVLEASIISQLEQEPNIEWKAVKESLLSHYGAPTFKSWFSKLSLASVDERLVKIYVPTGHAKEYISTHYWHILQKLWRKHLGSDITLELAVAVS